MVSLDILSKKFMKCLKEKKIKKIINFYDFLWIKKKKNYTKNKLIF